MRGSVCIRCTHISSNSLVLFSTSPFCERSASGCKGERTDLVNLESKIAIRMSPSSQKLSAMKINALLTESTGGSERRLCRPSAEAGAMLELHLLFL